MGQRVYETQFENVAISAVQDIFSLLAGSANGIEIHEICLGALSQTSASEFRLSLKRFTSPTQGSGGSTPTVYPADAGDSKSSTATVHANDTTQASGTGGALLSWSWNVLLPFDYLPAPEDREICAAGSLFALTLNGAPGASTNVSGFIKWRELP